MIDPGPCRLVRDPCKIGDEKLDEQRGRESSSSSGSLCHAKNTGQEAMEEHEPPSCLLNNVLNCGCVKINPFIVMPCSGFDDPFCIFGLKATPSQIESKRKWTIVSCRA